MWTIDQGLHIVRALQSHTRQFGYHLTLGGGVLNKGESKKDLDLYFLPMGGFDGDPRHRPDEMLRYLSGIWGTPEPLAKSLQDREKYGRTESFYKHAVQFTRWGGPSRTIRQRIDCFIF